MPCHAATVEAAGWWTATPLALAPDAPGDALVVEGGVTEPRSYAAVRYALAPSERTVSLTLSLAPGSASTPNSTLRLCPLSELFRPVRGGPIADAPDFDCATSVEVAPAGDGRSYTFDVAGLVVGDELAVAVLPTAATDRVVLADLADDALVTASSTPTPRPAAPSGATSSVDATTVPAEAAPASAPPVTPRPNGGGTVPSAARDAPAASTVPSAPAASAAPAAAVPSAATVDAAPASSREGTTWFPPALFVGLAAVVAALWAGRRPDDGDIGAAAVIS